MVAPDYQEFANRGLSDVCDNTVICGFRTRRNRRNRPCVARLQRHGPGRKRNFPRCGSPKALPVGQNAAGRDRQLSSASHATLFDPPL